MSTAEPAYHVSNHGEDRRELTFEARGGVNLNVVLTSGAMRDIARIVDTWRWAGVVPPASRPVCDHCGLDVEPREECRNRYWCHMASGLYMCANGCTTAEVGGTDVPPGGVNS